MRVITEPQFTQAQHAAVQTAAVNSLVIATLSALVERIANRAQSINISSHIKFHG